MQIDLYINFYKKENSTKRPAAGGIVSVTSVTGYLREPTSVMRPVIDFTPALPVASGQIIAYTYAYIPLFSRYYFIEDWMWNNGLWSCQMTEDVLATYKNDIGDASEFILRTDSDTADFNGAIIDTAYPATTDFNITHTPLQNPFQTELEHGVYILGVISNDGDSIGAISYYAMTDQEFDAFNTMMLTNANLNAMDLYDANTGQWLVTDMSQEIFKTMYNPFQYVVSCMWFPIDEVGIYGSYDTTIPVGWWEYILNGKKLLDTSVVFVESCQMPVHPQAATRGKYLNYAPYTKMTLHGKFGSIPIDTSFIEVGSWLIGYYTVDLITGKCLYEVFVAEDSAGTNRRLLTKTEFLLGTPIQIAQVGTDYLGVASAAISAGSDIINGAISGFAAGGVGGAIAGGIMSGVSGIRSTIEAGMPQMRTEGSNGSFINMVLSSVLISINYIITDEDIHHKGRPLCEMRQIKNLSGYVLCADGEIDIAGFDNERKSIAQYLTSGFFWE